MYFVADCLHDVGQEDGCVLLLVLIEKMQMHFNCSIFVLFCFRVLTNSAREKLLTES